MTKIINFALLLNLLLIPTVTLSAVQLGMEVNPSPAAPGQILDIALTVTNDGNATTGEVSLRLSYPAGLNTLNTSFISTGGTANSVTCLGGSNSNLCSTSEVIVWDLNNLAPGVGVTVSLPPRVANSVADGTLLTFDAELRVDGIQQILESRTIKILTDSFFELEVAESSDPVKSGEQLEYTLSYSNIGTASSNTILQLPLPMGTSFVSASSNGSHTASIVNWNLGSLPGGVGGQQSVIVDVNADEGDILEADSASLSGTDGGFMFRQVKTSMVTRVENDGRPTLSISLNPQPVSADQNLDIELTVTNPGITTLFNTELRLRYPAGLDTLNTNFISTGGAANSVTCEGGSNSTLCSTSEFIVWGLNNLPPNSGVTISLPPTVGNSIVDGTLLIFDAELRVDGRQQVLESRAIQVQADPFFELEVSESLDPVKSGEHLKYTLNYANIGTASSDTVLQLPLPIGASFVSASANGSHSAGIVSWNLGSLPGGVGGQQSVTVDINANEGGILEIDSASLSGTDGGFMFQQVKTALVTRVENDKQPVLSISLNPQPVSANQKLDIVLTVTNPGITTLFNTELRLRYPAGLDTLNTNFISTGGAANSVTCEGGSNSTLCSNSEVIVWDLNNLPPGGGVTLSLPPEVGNSITNGTLLLFDAELRVDGIQHVLESRAIEIQADPFFELEVVESLDPVKSGEKLEYTLSYGNIGTASSNTVLQLPLPTGTSFVSASANGSHSAGIVSWNLGSLPGGVGGQQTVIVDVNADEGAMLEVDSAKLSGTDSGLIFHQVKTALVTRINNDDRPILSISLNPQPVKANSNLNIELTLSNPSISTLFNTELRLRYPAGLDTLSTNFISTGGAANSVTCFGGSNSTLCSNSEVLVWDLNNLPPGGGITVSLPPEVRNSIADGTLLVFDAELRSDGRQILLESDVSFVGSIFRIGQNSSNDFCIPILAKNGAIVLICL